MMTALLKKRIGSHATDGRLAQMAFVAAAGVFPALICFCLLPMQLTTWQWLVSMIAAASLGVQLLIVSFLCRFLGRGKDGA